MPMPDRIKPQLNKTTQVRIGHRTVMAQGIETRFWADFYHQCMVMTWPRFFFSFAGIFLAINTLFAVLYLFGHEPVANIRKDHPEDLFFFSIETLATVGYGDMHPQTTYGHVIATIEIFTGMFLIAAMTGLVFNRFSRPRARILFARSPVIGQHNGLPTLMLRMANERHTVISEATAALWVSLLETSKEGVRMRRFHQLPLERNQNPLFALSWTIFHAIKPASPLFNMTESDLEKNEALLVVTFSGTDDTASQSLNARQTYAWHDIRWHHSYRDILHTDKDGQSHIDYSYFHDTQKQTPDPSSPRQ